MKGPRPSSHGAPYPNTTQHPPHSQVRLPPLSSIIPQQLTESNLSSWTQTQNGLGLLSAIAQMGEKENDPYFEKKDYYAGKDSYYSKKDVYSPGSSFSAPSSQASLTPSSSSLTPVSSPDLDKGQIREASEAVRNTTAAKRRQRLGPSCDSCRSRKVKCNAEINILMYDSSEAEICAKYSLSAEQYATLERGENVPIREGLFYVMSNGKLIRFRACKSCNSKRLSCCFSNGFTKEDMLSNKKKPKKIQKKDVALISKTLSDQRDEESGRKSSCVSCRKRKVKCVYNEVKKSCDVCVKKGSECVFGRKT